MILPAIAKLIRDTQAITSLVDDRVFWDRIPEGNSYPAILLSEINSQPQDVLDGKPSCDESIIQVDCWIEDSEEALQLIGKFAHEVRTLLEGYCGTVEEIGSNLDSVYIHGSTLLRNEPRSTTPANGSSRYRRSRSMDFRIIHDNNVGS